MSTTKPTGGPAFPVSISHTTPEGAHIALSGGMTLRDWFATHSPFTVANAVQIFEQQGEAPKGPDVAKMLAHMSYVYADEMIAARQE